MTKISQLTALGSALAAGDQFFLRDISDASTPIKSVTADNIVELLLYGGDIGTAPNQIPLNQFLGSMAFEDNDAITVGKIAVDVNSAASPSIAISNDPDTGIYSPGDNQLAIATGGTERLRVTSTGQLRLAGAGITFNGDTATANELDDYEEGTWTPALNFGGASTGITYNARQGYYIKIGRMVFVTVYFNLSSKGTATGNSTVTGLPFTSEDFNISGTTSWPGARPARRQNQTATDFVMSVQDNTTTIGIGDGANNAITDTTYTNGTIIECALMYRAAT